MLRRIIVVGAVAGAAVVAGATTAIATSSGPDITRAENLFFAARTTSFILADVNNNHRPDPGETFVLVDTLHRHGQVVGRNYISCTFVTRSVTQCTYTVNLRAGKISGNGSVPANTRPGRSFVIPVTGGSGRFANVRGDARITEGRGDLSTYRVHLLP